MIQHTLSLVFRELLQNSDDAASNSVEIYFETQSYLNRKETEATAVSDGTSVLPNLKTELVSLEDGDDFAELC